QISTKTQNATELSTITECHYVQQPVDIRGVEKQKPGQQIRIEATLTGHQYTQQNQVKNQYKEKPDSQSQPGSNRFLTHPYAHHIGQSNKPPTKQRGRNNKA